MNTGLTCVTCPCCDGEGGEVYLAGGYKAHHSGACLPRERTSICDLCEGTGELEVCTHCLEPLEVVRGEEVCGCIAVSLAEGVRQAA